MSLLDTLRAWFGGNSDDQSLSEGAPPPPPPPRELPPSTTTLPEVPTGPIDFPAVLAAAGVSVEVRQRVLKAKQLLRSMPDAKPAMKRKIVEAAFQAFDIPTEKIVEGASAEVVALREYVRVGEEEKTSRLADGARRIEELEAEIRNVRASMDQAVAAQEEREQLTRDEIATVSPIVDFFQYESNSIPPPRAETEPGIAE